MGSHSRILTADELLRMPDDGFRYELVNGTLVQMSPAGFEHGVIGVRLSSAVAQHVDRHELGEVSGPDTGFKLTSRPDTVRAPDVAFVRRERIPTTGLPDQYWPGAPDLAVEILSPDDRPQEVFDKIEEYFACGVREIWVVDPSVRTVRVHRPNAPPESIPESGMLDGGEVLPGFRHPVSNLFRGLA